MKKGISFKRDTLSGRMGLSRVVPLQGFFDGQGIGRDNLPVDDMSIKNLLDLLFIQITVFDRRQSRGLDGDHGFATAKPCAAGVDHPDISDVLFLHVPEDQGLKLLGPCSNSAGPHVEVDLGPDSSLLKGESPTLSFS